MPSFVSGAARSAPGLPERVRVRAKIVAMTLAFKVRGRLGRRPMVDDALPGVVVSMASHGRRLDNVAAALESIARGARRPGRIILVVDENDELPRAVTRMMRRGLEVWRGPARYGPHNKYYLFAAAEPDFDGTLVIADDDMVYPRAWLDGLVSTAAPDTVAAYRAHAVKVDHGDLAPYATWVDNDDPEAVPCFVTGCAGAAFPSRFVREIAALGEEFLGLCPRNDDIWLTRQILRGGYHLRLVLGRSVHFTTLYGSWHGSLAETNVDGGGNDRQLDATFTAGDRALLVAVASGAGVGLDL